MINPVGIVGQSIIFAQCWGDLLVLLHFVVAKCKMIDKPPNKDNNNYGDYL